MTPKVWNKRDPNTPADAVYVGRPTKWGNPFRLASNKVGDVKARERVVNLYRSAVLGDEELMADVKRELRGKHLVCWCAPKPCHADVLLEIANS